MCKSNFIASMASLPTKLSVSGHWQVAGTKEGSLDEWLSDKARRGCVGLQSSFPSSEGISVSREVGQTATPSGCL